MTHYDAAEKAEQGYFAVKWELMCTERKAWDQEIREVQTQLSSIAGLGNWAEKKGDYQHDHQAPKRYTIGEGDHADITTYNSLLCAGIMKAADMMAANVTVVVNWQVPAFGWNLDW